MKEVPIKQHLWKNGGEVGIAHYINDDIEVSIDSRDSSGNLLYPHKYRYPKEKLMALKVVKHRKGVPVREVPIRDMIEIKNTVQPKEKEKHMFNLTDYKPEAVKEGGFAPFKYKGAVRVNYARIVKAEKASEYHDTPAGYNNFELEVEVIDGEYAKRKLWKRVNLDSTKANKKDKTPVQTLADQLFSLKLQFSTLEELQAVCEQLVELTPTISAYYFKDDKNEDVQVWNITGLPSESAGSSTDF